MTNFKEHKQYTLEQFFSNGEGLDAEELMYQIRQFINEPRHRERLIADYNKWVVVEMRGSFDD